MLQVSKTDKSDPKRLRKDLPKLVKNIAPEDQMMLIGGSFKAESVVGIIQIRSRSGLIGFAPRHSLQLWWLVPEAEIDLQ